jgi:hypothetical protein
MLEASLVCTVTTGFDLKSMSTVGAWLANVGDTSA